jgi:DNA polymerase
MSEDITKKIHGFFQWYHDLYGGSYFIDKNKISKSEQIQSSRSQKFSPLEQFYNEIKNCQKCPLYKGRTNFVFGVGNENADIMFVGEAPGKYEDLQGEPFVGRAGQLLNKLLDHIHLKRSDVYIANILKSRPPNNRDPLPEEVQQCIPYLHRQIEIIQPKVLVALGRIAAQNLLNTNDTLGKMKSKVWMYRSVPLFVIYHPAAVLRNMGLLDTALEDFRSIAKYYKDLN